MILALMTSLASCGSGESSSVSSSALSSSSEAENTNDIVLASFESGHQLEVEADEGKLSDYSGHEGNSFFVKDGDNATLTIRSNGDLRDYFRFFIEIGIEEEIEAIITINGVSPTAFWANGEQLDANYLDAGFIGYLSIPLNGEVDSFSISLALNGQSAHIDDIVLSNERTGIKRPVFGKEGTMTLNEKKTRQEKVYAEALKAAPRVDSYAEFDPSSTFDGIKAYVMDGLPIDGKKTKMFMYLGLPSGYVEGKKYPAMILIHGGGGHPFLEWMKTWQEMGYVTLAYDTTGYFPTAQDAGNSETDNRWTREVPKDLQDKGYIGTPELDNVYPASNKPLEQQWIYHGVGGALLAHSYLKTLPFVDETKIGAIGISWGGVVLSLVIGYDNELALAVPIYGSGYLDEAHTYMGDRFAGEANQVLWMAQDRFDKATMPILWLCWNSDTSFSINSNSKSYFDTKALNPLTRASFVDGMLHSHSIAWSRSEPFFFADMVLNGGTPLPSFIDEPSSSEISLKVSVPPEAKRVRAKAYYLLEELRYINGSQAEPFTDTTLVYEDGIVSGSIPSTAKSLYIELRSQIGGINYITSSGWVEL